MCLEEEHHWCVASVPKVVMMIEDEHHWCVASVFKVVMMICCKQFRTYSIAG